MSEDFVPGVGYGELLAGLRKYGLQVTSVNHYSYEPVNVNMYSSPVGETMYVGSGKSVEISMTADAGNYADFSDLIDDLEWLDIVRKSTDPAVHDLYEQIKMVMELTRDK